MRWGVRKAIATGNQRLLDKHYRKAAKKLAKLQRLGDHPGLSKAKAAAYGAAAAGTGALAIGGTGLASKGLQYFSAGAKTIRKNKFAGKSGKVVRVGKKRKNLLYNALEGTERLSGDAAKGLTEWAKGSTKFKLERPVLDPKTNTIVKSKIFEKDIGNNTLFRAGAGLATAGLAARAAHHAYRAKNAEKYREKAERWKEAMDQEFEPTNYAGHYEKTSRRQQKRRRRYGY